MNRVASMLALLRMRAGCGPTKRTTTADYAGVLPQPELIVDHQARGWSSMSYACMCVHARC